MNSEVKAKWEEALESGRYEQGKGNLLFENRFCCLGVLCDLYSKEHNIPWDGRKFLGEDLVLPRDVRLWSGVKEANPHVVYKGKIQPLAVCNDDGNENFTSIAAIIREQL